MISRRLFVSGLTASGIVVGAQPARSGSIETLTLGFQKTGIPLVARLLKIFERRFEKRGIAVNWVEFTSGLNLLQAMDIGNVSFGNAGNVGCIFVQASGGQIVYLAGQPSGPKSEGILVKGSSPIRSIADLKGKKVGYAKGSSSHNLIAAALEQNGLSIADITSVSLGAADAALAFENGSIDAWVVWDPYFALAQARSETRVLTYSGDILPDNASFLLANSTFANSHPELVRDLIDGSAEAGAWAKAHLDEVKAALSQATGINPKVLAEVNARASFDVVPLSDAILSQQQKTADRLTRLGVVPKQISVRDIVWRPPA
ncbi:aliphatic sulfonate ABC transporter substrate-binding protein [Bradyrhizobium arachidis]|nr:aliphatic sulfonate ABC transporter substrate-binding protein [Bradyrhizobium arachidis]SFU79665.1 sulfonate transport system substrate-binding protein [Bradyrhizobium arachidis]